MAIVNPYKLSSSDLELEYCRTSSRLCPPMAAAPAVVLLSNASNTNARLSAWRKLATFCGGIFFGLFMAILIRKCILGSFHLCLSIDRPKLINQNEKPFDIIGGDPNKYPHNSDKNLLFVGVMTAQQFLDTRAVAVYETWAQQIPGKIAFFTSENSVSNSKIPIIRLKGVDDSYPPQKKSFMMLKYMHDHFLNNFEFFMRADDDLYSRPDKLERFLRSVNSSQLQFIGQTGRGNNAEFGLLSLLDYENFCMGGPGVILSRPTLARVAPHVKDCLHNMHTTHEDVELGRCVQKYAGVSCTWSYEMRHILYHNSSGSEAFTGVLKQPELHHAITLHPVKNYMHLYRLHHYLQEVKVSSVETEVVQLLRELGTLHRHRSQLPLPALDNARNGVFLSHLGAPATLQVGRGTREDTVQPYSLVSKLQFSLDSSNPRHRPTSAINETITDVIAHTMETINELAKERGRDIEYRNLLYGYVRGSAGVAVQLLLDMLLLYRRYRGNKITLPVRRHGYLQVPFGPLYVRELPSLQHSITSAENPQGYATRLGSSAAAAAGGSVPDMQTVHFILPLAGRHSTFLRFTKNYERVVLQKQEAATLTVVYYSSSSSEANVNGRLWEGFASAADTDDLHLFLNVIKMLTLKYPAAVLTLVKGKGQFSRASALQFGAEQGFLSSSDILFCVDVDMAFTDALLHRIRLHTRRGKQVYFPIVFSEFDPSVVGPPPRDQFGHTAITEESGYFRNFGFGIVSVYKSDLFAVGGFNTSIVGWGGEDVDLYNKFVASKSVRVFRSTEPALVHVYHRAACQYSHLQQSHAGSQQDETQYSMCAGTVYSTHASCRTLARRVLANPDILHFAALRNSKTNTHGQT
uniref:Hexosyltransferase n=2 Tax=Hirondellea gigas TaxID=1518452 RepID=A0A6A7G7Z9_9CRUS